MKTDRFSGQHNIFFDSIDGAYTTMTDAEVGKSTFNVKVVIRNMVIKHLGEKKLTKFDASNSSVKFNGCDKISGFEGKTFKVVFKFSKPPPKKEMTIYLNKSAGIPDNKLRKGNIWFIYFRKDNPDPWIGIMSPAEWANVTGVDYYDDDIEIEEKKKKISYKFDINTVDILEVPPPEKSAQLLTPIKKKKEILCETLQNRLENRKITGTKGEEIVMEFERRRLTRAGRKDLAKKIEWVSSEIDGLGYDIKSFDLLPNGKENEMYIEVKTTQLGKNTPFNISLNEVEVSKKYGKSYYIYRIYNLNQNGSDIKLYITNGSVEDNFELSAVAFKAVKK